MLGCDYCENFYHILCLVPPMLTIPAEEWICPAFFGDSVMGQKLYEGPDLPHAVRNALADCENSETISAISRKYGVPRQTLVDNMAKMVAAQTTAAAEGTVTEIGTSNAEGKAAHRNMYDHKHLVCAVNWGIKHKKSGYHAAKSAKEHFCLVSPFTVSKQTAEKHIQYTGTQLGIKSGRKSFFTPEETGALAHIILDLHATGMGLESKQVRKVAT